MTKQKDGASTSNKLLQKLWVHSNSFTVFKIVLHKSGQQKNEPKAQKCRCGKKNNFIIRVVAVLLRTLFYFIFLLLHNITWHTELYTSVMFFLLGKYLFQNKETYEPLCKVPLMTSSKEEQRLIATSNKVCYIFVFCLFLWYVNFLRLFVRNFSFRFFLIIGQTLVLTADCETVV